MAGKGGGFKARLEAARAKHRLLDHLLSMNEHYGSVQGNVLAGAVTYFGFLSFFPILAIAFAVVGYVSATFPDARDHLVTAIEQLFPGIVSDTGDPGTISLQQIEDNSATAGIIGFITLLYTGLGWVSGLRLAPGDGVRRAEVGQAVVRRRQGDRSRCARRGRSVLDHLRRHRRDDPRCRDRHPRPRGS